jgi:hypothetical protein
MQGPEFDPQHWKKKEKTTSWEKIFAKYVSDQELVSRIYVKNSKNPIIRKLGLKNG